MRYFHFNIKKQSSGQAMLISVILFLSISSIIVMGIATPILKQVKNSIELVHSKETYYLAEAGMEDALYRLKTGKTVASGDTITINGASSVITLTTTSAGKTIDATATIGGRVRKMEAQVKTGAGNAFNYGIQGGVGGITFSNNASVVGNVYVNGPIVGASGAYITGSAVSANSFSQTIDQYNDTPTTPTNAITFGDTGTTQDFGQSFQASTSTALSQISVYIKKLGSPSDITLKIAADNSGKPSSVILTSGTLAAAGVTTSYGWVTVSFSNPVQLNPGVTYWIVLNASTGTAAKNYIIGANSGTYSLGNGNLGSLSAGTWSTATITGQSGYFREYVGGVTGKITGQLTVGQAGVGDAQAHTITNTTAAGKVYCQTGSGNSPTCDTSKADATPVSYPITDANIAQWKADASAGGTTTGNVTVSGSSSIGPQAITGNLIVNGTLTITGTIWVQGNITLGNGAIVQLASGYGANSGNIITDGTVVLSNNVQFLGSGQSGSYIMVLTTSSCPNVFSCAGAYAIDVSNNSGTVILNAQNGTVHLSNNAGAQEITAEGLYLSNNAQIVYTSGLSNVNFTSGPSGGYSITNWQEVQ